MYAHWLLWVGMQGCKTEEPEPLEPPCTTSVNMSYPSDGAVDVYRETSVLFSLDRDDPLATVTVTGPDGDVPGSSRVEGRSVIWQGEPLAPLTSYQATLSYECGEVAVSFTTSALSSPVEVSLEGRVYALDLSGAMWLQPAGAGSLIADQLSGQDLAMMVQEVGAQEIAFTAASGAGAGQDLCLPTTPASGRFSDPSFAVASDQPLFLPLEASMQIIETPSATGTFSPDGERLRGGRLQGLLRTEHLGYDFGLGTDPGAVCELVATFGVRCEPCPDGANTCLPLWVEDFEGTLVRDSEIVERTQDEIAGDPACGGQP